MDLIPYGTRQIINKLIFLTLNKRDLELKCVLGIIQYNYVQVISLYRNTFIRLIVN